MIYEKIFVAEQRIKSTVRVNQNKLVVLDNIKEYINKIDTKTELLVIKDLQILERTLKNLKGNDLDEEEQELIYEVFTSV